MWFAHPAYAAVRDRLVKRLQYPKYRFRRAGAIVFLCGGKNSTNRDTLRDYFRKNAPDLSFFYAERAWEHIATHLDRGALKMESDLALLADLVIIIVESPGTFAELGAFSLSEPLRKKLLAIVDEEYRSEQHSFIATGPLKWIDRESKFGPTVFVPFPRILQAVDEIEKRIARIPKPRPAKLSDLAASPKHLLLFLCDLIAVIYPATLGTVQDYLHRIKPELGSSDINLPTLLGLGVAMELLRAMTLDICGGRETFFYPSTPDAVGRPFHHQYFSDLCSQRAEHAAVLLSFPDARSVLKAITGTK